jgi:hypothetical protein
LCQPQTRNEDHKTYVLAFKVEVGVASAGNETFSSGNERRQTAIKMDALVSYNTQAFLKL